jgi:hypothetical protein
MFRIKTLSPTTRIEDLTTTTDAAAPVALPTAELAVIAGGGRWRPSWTMPQDPDDIFRDDG